MSYFVLMGRRIPKQAITGFKFQNETDNIRPFLSIRIRGKDEIIPFKDKKEIQSVKAHLCSIFSGFVKIGDWYLKMSEVKEYKPVTAEDMNPYILFKTSKFGNIKVRFPKDEDMDAELLVLDQLFDVERIKRQNIPYDRRRATTRSCSMGRKYESNERLFLGENRRGYVLQL